MAVFCQPFSPFLFGFYHLFCDVYSHLFTYLWHCNLQDELVSPEGWDIRTIGLLFTTDTVKALSKLLHEVICFEEGCYLGATREVGQLMFNSLL